MGRHAGDSTQLYVTREKRPSAEEVRRKSGEEDGAWQGRTFMLCVRS